MAEAAREAIWEEIRRWESLPARESSPRLASLAEFLARHCESWNPAARADAADLAARILQWPLDQETVARNRVVAACEKTLRLGLNERSGTVLPPSTALADSSESVEQASRQDRQAALSSLGKVPAGGLPIEIAPFPERDADPAALPKAANRGEPDRLTVPAPYGLVNRLPRAWRPPPDSDGTEAEPDAGGSSVANGPIRLSPIKPLTLTKIDPPKKEDATQAERRLEDAELMRQLHAADADVAHKAEFELRRRGLSPALLQVAKALFSPDPEVRRQLAQALPTMRGVDAAPWLLQLARDEEPEVRRTAITLLATTGDPAVVEQVRRIAQADPDPRIQQQAERLGTRQSAGGFR